MPDRPTLTKTRVCEKCKKTLKEDTNFYTYKNGTKVEICKACLTMHIDNYDPKTFCWILEKLDIPYVPSEWNILRDRAFNKDPNKINGASVLGKYISKMRLKKWIGFGWKDSEKLQEEEREREKAAAAEEENRQKQLKIAFENGEITEAEYRTFADTAELNKAGFKPEQPALHNAFTGEIVSSVPPSEYMSPDELAEASGDLGSQLTQEDKVYLAMKWGRLYTPEEWISLEKNYTEMCNSFDIQDQDTKNTLILLCKTNLKMNQAMDSNDYEGATKFSRMYETLRKSANFTAAQNKKEDVDQIDAVGKIVAFCEKEGGIIPPYNLDIPKDTIDVVINDLKGYTSDLIKEDPLIARQIEEYIKMRKIQDKKRFDSKTAREEGKEVAFELENQDYLDYIEEKNKAAAADEQEERQ